MVGGEPLSLDETLDTGILSPGVIPLIKQDAFPALAHADHPILGTPTWYLHPCETPSAVLDLLRDHPEPHDDLLWLDTWFSILTTAIRFQPLLSSSELSYN